MRFSVKFSIIFVLCLTSRSVLAFGNEDVVKLISAGFSEEMILKAVSSANPATFDTSADGLIELKKAGASDAVIQKVLSRQNAHRSVPQPGIPATAPVANGENCETETTGMEDRLPVRAEGKITPLLYQEAGVVNETDGMSALASAFTFGIVRAKGNASLRINGERASVRITENMPEFLDILFPLGASPENTLVLVRMTVAEKSRIIQITSASMGITGSSGRSMDFGENVRVPLRAEKVANQCMWRGKQWTHYKMKPAAPLAKGEYGFLMGTKIFDFAVD